MAWESVQIVVVVVLVFLDFLRERHPPDVVAMIASGVLLATGILSTGEALSVFANSGPITVACMFVLNAALERTGVIEVAGGAAARLAGRSATGALVTMTLCVMTVSDFINNTPVGGDGDLGGLGLIGMEAQRVTDDPLPAPDINQKVSLACRRAIHVQRVAALRDLISAA